MAGSGPGNAHFADNSTFADNFHRDRKKYNHLYAYI